MKSAAHARREIARDGKAEAGARRAFIDAAVEPLEGAKDALRFPRGDAGALSSKVKPRQLTIDAPALMVACGLAMRRFDPA